MHQCTVHPGGSTLPSPTVNNLGNLGNHVLPTSSALTTTGMQNGRQGLHMDIMDQLKQNGNGRQFLPKAGSDMAKAFANKRDSSIKHGGEFVLYLLCLCTLMFGRCFRVNCCV